MKNFLRDILMRIQLDENSATVTSMSIAGEDTRGRCWRIQGESNIDGVEEQYFVYDCSEKDFDIEVYRKIMEEEEGISRPIIVFKNWEHEWEMREQINKGLTKAKERRELLELFEKAMSFYTDLQESIKLNVEENGVNFLEYRVEDDDNVEDEIKSLKGRIYNISFEEIKKIFNITGESLFRKNVRFGLKKNVTGNKILIKFKEYIKVGAYIAWVKEHQEDKECEVLKALFGIGDDFLIKKPENFWYYHNGVTFFYYGKNDIDYSGSYIEMNPKKISVINGAQTLTNFFTGIKRLPEEFATDCEAMIEEKSKNENLKVFFNEYVKLAMREMKVKTIIIDGPEQFVKHITYGLNTQIPILEEDIIADSTDVQKINFYLKHKNMKIKKTGENGNIEKEFLVLEFVKKYLIINRMPGKSKNLRKTDLDKYIKEARKTFENSADTLLEAFSTDVAVDEWWVSTKKEREDDYIEETDKPLLNYGKNYFESFVLCEKEGEIDDDYLSILFNQFINIFKKLKPEMVVEDFKKDELFQKYWDYRIKQKQEGELLLNQSECDQLQNYLNKNEMSMYTMQKSISEYLNEQGKSVVYFRVIARKNEKAREAFPFPNTTFSELYTKEESPKEYMESNFSREIIKTFPVFVIDWREGDGQNNKRTIEKIRFIPEFSFKDYEDDAKVVYNLTVKAFEEGKEEEFPKMKDSLSFHVRPKAVNGEDTFEFTNGKQITKRTFWANKKTIDDIIEKNINQAER